MKPVKEKRITKKSLRETGAILAPGPDNYRCQQCQLFTKANAPFKQWVELDTDNPTVVIAIAPLDSGEKLWYDIRQMLFAGTGLAFRKNLAIIHPVLCMPYHRKLTAQNLDWCKPFVTYEIAKLSPVRVLAMGAQAVRQIADDDTSIRRMIGKDVTWGDVPLTVTYDPSAALKGRPEFLVSIRRHIHRMMHGLSVSLPAFPGWRRA